MDKSYAEEQLEYLEWLEKNPQTKKRIEVDDGFVEIVGCMGSDLTVVNAARTSFGKQKSSLDEKDIQLIKYLAKHKHMSPFRHIQFSFKIYTNEVVLRQWYKHQVGCGWTCGDVRFESTPWNEASGRYTEFREFHHPTSFRKQHSSNKQASLQEQIEENDKAIQVYEDILSKAQKAYDDLLALGVCREQARMVLPVSFMSTVVWTASLEAIINFIKLRDHEGAQWEIRKLAQAVYSLIEPFCPHSVNSLMKEYKV